MKRRNFIKLSSSVSVAALLPIEVFSYFRNNGILDCPNVNNRKLVLIQLSGANDGLNTLVPLNQYDLYATLRPTIKLNNIGQTNGVINLDTTLPIENQVGLHPVLTGFKNLYDSGFMRIIQGVGYPSSNKSHFKSTDIWLSGGDGTVANSSINSGWMGRLLENYYANFLTSNFPLAIQLGSSDNSLGFHGETEHGMSLNINGQNISGYYSVINGLSGTPPNNIPNSEYGDLIQYILENDTTTNTYAETITNSFNAGTNSVTYPSTSLANQLKSVARFISGGLETKIYLVKLTGFDTHDLQVANDGNNHLGTHANLLTELSEAVHTFITDLNNQNLGDDVVAVTFSEFGRKAAENANFGTDHGEIAPMFVFGKGIEAGISGTNVNLAEAEIANNYQIQTVQYDYRRVFGTILQDWLGTSNNSLNLTFYDQTNNTGFSSQKITPFLKNEALVPESCYTDSVLSNQELAGYKSISIFPNPAQNQVSLIADNSDYIHNINVYSYDGKHLFEVHNFNANNPFTIDCSSLSNGIYIITLTTSSQVVSKKLMIRR